MALERCYQRYRGKAEFFFVHLARRSASGFWFNVADRAEMVERGSAAAACPSAAGVTIPRLLDDAAGTADYLFRADPFRVCIVDLDGRIAYHSPDGQRDFQTDKLDEVLAGRLDPLLANGGRLTPEMAARGRCDAVGQPAVPCWLPRVEYFAPPLALAPAAAKAPAGSTVDVSDARGYQVKAPKPAYAAMLKKRALVARLFAPGAPPAPRPVVLLFTGPRPSDLAAAAPGLQAFYRAHRGQADIYLVYAGLPGALRPRAAAAAAWVKANALTLPCLLDDPENDVSYAYGAPAAPRACLVTPAGRVAASLPLANPAAALAELETALAAAR